jgi:hypothetical protein
LLVRHGLRVPNPRHLGNWGDLSETEPEWRPRIGGHAFNRGSRVGNSQRKSPGDGR